ncbi:hypothetical protein [Mesobacillus harenae]|uniref:hypothetical protein n=1 Tax=Mesobacillus harenae TaxID=2213203 RepID=UPI001580C91F|nr:hypothetical protein [Mesobacillus harenae]
MTNKGKFEKLFRDYGYPEDEIPRLMREAGNSGYEEIRKRIMPYKDISAERP